MPGPAFAARSDSRKPSESSAHVHASVQGKPVPVAPSCPGLPGEPHEWPGKRFMCTKWTVHEGPRAQSKE